MRSHLGRVVTEQTSMAVTLLTSPVYGALFGDPELAEILSDAQDVARMIRFERALARVQGELGVIPPEAAGAIDTGLAGLRLDPETLAAGTLAAGVPVPALVAALRAALPDGHGHWLHWGATSQDVVDSAQMMALRDVATVLAGRLAGLTATLQQLAVAQAGTVMAARTRGQIATPITFGLRIAQWAAPLIEASRAVPRASVQFGGASGGHTAIAPHGPAVSRALAQALDLDEAAPWHTNRSRVAAFADWQAGIAQALAKLAEDLMLMTRSEIAEVRAGRGGGSSTMPQKSNPVEVEAIATLCRLVAVARAGLGLPHREERDGASWALEWALLPQIALATGAALRHAQALMDTLVPDAVRMRSNLEASPGAMAEAASFALAGHMPRAEAQALVKEALAAEEPFAEALAERSPAALDWAEILSPDQVVAPCRAVIDDIFARGLSP